MADIDEAELRRQLAIMRMSRDEAESRLAAVRALCERNFNMEDHYEIDANDVAAIIEGRAVLAAVDGPADHIALFDGPPLYPGFNNPATVCLNELASVTYQRSPGPEGEQ